jgi:GDPmannose 4,6-dehydratase
MSEPRHALITGIAGQDGSYLAELLLEKGYEVHGTARGVEQLDRVEQLRERITLHPADLRDQGSLVDALRAARPTEIYNLAALSFPAASWEDPLRDAEVTGLGAMRVLEAMRQVCPDARFCQASSSEIFGRPAASPQDEETPLRPRSPYGLAKAHAHLATSSYRDTRDLHASSAILFNHESPRRGLEFVTRKITWHAAAIRYGLETELALGNLDTERDWGYAKDYVEAMWLMLQQDTPADYVIATGESHSVRECCQIAFGEAGLGDPEQYIVVDPDFVRPREPVPSRGDPAKATRVLGWEHRMGFEELIRLMTRADLELLAGSQADPGRGGPG